MKLNKTNLFLTLIALTVVLTSVTGDICKLINFAHPLGELVFCLGGMLLAICFGIQSIEIKTK